MARNEDDLVYMLLDALTAPSDSSPDDFRKRVAEALQQYMSARRESQELKPSLWGMSGYPTSLGLISHSPYSGYTPHETRMDSIVAMVDETRNVTQHQLDELKSRCAHLEHEIVSSARQFELVKTEFFDAAWHHEIGVRDSRRKSQWTLPVRVFFSNPYPGFDARRAVYSSLLVLLREFDLYPIVDLDEISGSVFKRFFVRVRGLITHDEVKDRVRKAEQALNLAYRDKPFAEVNHLNALAAASLITALQNTSEASIQVGSLVVVKTKNIASGESIIVRNLTAEQLRRLEEQRPTLGSGESLLQLVDNEEDGE